jgi:hypothetical protein
LSTTARRRTDELAPDIQPRHLTPQPRDRTPPFVLLRQAENDILITPFSKRSKGPSPDETALVKSVAHLLVRNLPAGCFWIDARDSSATPAILAVSQLRRRLIDYASFHIRIN